MTTTEESTLCGLAPEVGAEPRFCTENFAPVRKVRLSSEFARLRQSFTLKMHSRLSNVTVQMLLYLYVNLRLMNKLTSEMGNLFTDTMRDSNSHEFEEMVDPITCTPNEEPEENIVEIDETFPEKESSVATVFS